MWTAYPFEMVILSYVLFYIAFKSQITTRTFILAKTDLIPLSYLFLLIETLSKKMQRMKSIWFYFGLSLSVIIHWIINFDTKQM